MTIELDLTALLADEHLLASYFHDQAGWQARGRCSETDPEAFFPEKGGSTREAKRICLGCEVKDECLQAAIDHDERFGIWGGLSERERRQYKRTGTIPGNHHHFDPEFDRKVAELTAQGLLQGEIADRLSAWPSRVGRAQARNRRRAA